MTTRSINGSIINLTVFRAPAAVGESGPTLLAGTELDQVAAAGSKPGTSGGQIRIPPPHPSR